MIYNYKNIYSDIVVSEYIYIKYPFVNRNCNK